MPEDFLIALERAKTDIISTLEKKTFWDRVLPLFQVAILLIGGFWGIFTYYVDRHERALTPAKIGVQPSLDDLGVYQGLRFLKVTIAVENSGAKSYVVNSPFKVYAHKIKSANPAEKPVDNLWDRTAAADLTKECILSGEAFGRGNWFEPGEHASRTYIVAVPEGKYDFIDIRASMHHVKSEDSSLGTDWQAGPDKSLTAVTTVNVDGTTEKADILKHADLWKRTSMSMNEGDARLALWAAPRVVSSIAAPQK
jgi:hypothetical protein